MTNWNSEDDKLAVLAKGARSRVQAKVGAALRDETGRTAIAKRYQVDTSASDSAIADG